MIALIDYGAGNTASVANALEDIGTDFKIVKSEIPICNSDKIILPGVGEASFAMQKIHMLNLFSLLRLLKKPFLGICLGMQILCEKSKEGNVACLGIFESTVQKFDNSILNVPHMGWNKVELVKESKLFEGIPNKTDFYFANSYYVPVNNNTIASSEYGIEFSAAIEKDNFYGVQFHPEKSGEAGLKLLKNFVEKC
jgi:glutamine amidotransferase